MKVKRTKYESMAMKKKERYCTLVFQHFQRICNFKGSRHFFILLGMYMKLPSHIEQAVRSFQRLQGVGRKTAERYVFDIISHWKDESIQDFSDALQTILSCKERCESCRAQVLIHGVCPFCSDIRKETQVIAVVASLKDLYSLESLHAFQGTYFLLENLLSPIDRRGIPDAIMEKLYDRIRHENVQEVFLALDSSAEGEATSFYITEAIKKQIMLDPSLQHLKVTAFATGVPVGSTFDYVDMSTLGKAFINRVSVG